MKPEPNDVVAGVRRVLSDVVAPELTSEHARARLREIRAVLAQVDWNDAGFALLRHNRELGSALRETADWVAADASRAAAFPALDCGVPEALDFAVQQQASERLCAATATLAEPFAAWLAAHPDDTEAARLRAVVLRAL